MLFLSVRHLTSRKKQSFFILLGVTLGVMVFVFISAMQLGFREFFLERLVENDGHVRISGKEEYITVEDTNTHIFASTNQHPIWVVPPGGKRDEGRILYPSSWFSRLKQDPDVLGYSEQFGTQVLVAKGGGKSTAMLMGIDPYRHRNITLVENYITEGNLNALSSLANRVIIGEGLLKKLGARLNDSITLSSSTSPPTPFKIVGVFKLGVGPIDDGYMYGALTNVQSFNRTPGRITQIAVKLVDVGMSQKKSAQWSTGSVDKVQSWEEASASFLEVFKIQDIFRNFITVGILLVAAFGIYNVLSIIVNQKRKEIAILKSLGFTPTDIRSIFMYQGLFIGLIGAVFGLMLGWFASYYMSQIQIEGMRHGMTISFNPIIYVQGFILAMGSSLLASLLPANAAAKMEPIEIIRSEGG